MSKKGSKLIEKPVVAENNDTYGSMKTGEYMVFIEETRALINPAEDDATVDAILQIESMGQKKYSEIKKGLGIGATVWNEHFFFNEVIDNVFELEHQMISITVSNHKTLGKDAKLGVIELDFSNVYGSEKHSVMHKWAALANIEKKEGEVLGYIKFSVSVITEGDETVQLKEEQLDEVFDPKSVMMPPFLDTKLHQLNITLDRGEGIKKMDTWGSVDCYVKLKFGAVTMKSKVINNTQKPTWHQTITIPMALPTVNSVLHLELYDHDTAKSDELIGSCHINLKEIQSGKFDNFLWINFYSSPPKSGGRYKDLMNTIPALASYWCGRVHLQMKLEENPKAGAVVKDFHDTKTIDELNAQPFYSYELRSEAFWAMNLPENGKEYFIAVRWADSETKTKELKVAKGRLAQWYQTLPPLNMKFPHENFENLPDVIIYLHNHDHQHFSFVRLPATHFLNQSTRGEVFYFKIDKALSSVRDDLAGVVKMRLWLHRSDDHANLSVGNWDHNLDKKPNMKKWRVIVNLYQAQDLIAADDDGSSDPICQIYFSGWIFKSQPIDNTLNPIWNFRMEFPAEFDEIEDCPPFLVSVWDYDGPVDPSDYLGGCVLQVGQESFGQKRPTPPAWRPLKYGTLEKDFGKILISFNIYPQEEKLIPYGDIDPPTTKYHLNIKALGLRGLKSLGVIDIKKPYVKFDLNSVRAPDQKQTVEEKASIQTLPKERGPNANLLTVINMELDLPLESLYCPSLSCRVHDFYLRGMAQPLLGTFSIPLGQYLERTRLKAAADTKDRSSSFTSALLTVKKKKEPSQSDEPQKLDEEEKIGTATTQQSLELPPVQKDSTASADPGSGLKFGLSSTKFSMPPNKITVMPLYEQDNKKGYQVEKNSPDSKYYVELGYDSKDRRSKHYRHYINKPLEESEWIDESPFDEIGIKRGSRVDDDSMFSKIFSKKKTSEVHESETVGYFKAMISIASDQEKKKQETSFLYGLDKLSCSSKIQNQLFGLPDVDFLKKAQCVCRVYILNAGDLSSKDEKSNSDPYLRLELGDTVVDESKHYLEDEPNPNFYKLIEFPAILPGAGMLKIAVMDHDEFSRDELIGETHIDIEDRWFSKKFRALEEVPIEKRQLRNPASCVSQGYIRLWTEVVTREEHTVKKKYDIAPKPPKNFELRVVIWDCEDIPLVDASGLVDLYISAHLDDGTKLNTDTHWRSTNGKGSFNWRLVFPVTLPLKSNRLTIQVWDKDVISSDDYIAETTLDFTHEAKEAFLCDQGVKMTGPNRKDEKFSIAFQKANSKKGGELSTCGKVNISFQLVPEEQAQLNKVGQGRSDPNQDPFLAPPVGRIKFSLNPLDMWEMYIGPVYRRRAYMICCCLLCIVILVFSMPNIIASILV